VAQGLEFRKVEDLSRVGMDEKSFLKGHRNITALNDVDRGQVLEVVEGRAEEDPLALWGKIPETRSAITKAIAMDMWQAVENVARRMVPEAEILSPFIATSESTRLANSKDSLLTEKFESRPVT